MITVRFFRERLGIDGQLLLQWFPALLCVVYLVAFVANFDTLIRRIYWNSDAASFTLAAQTVGHGSVVVLAHCSWLTSLWFLLLTRSVPFHRQLWDVAPYVASLVAIAMLALASWRLAGRWAAAMTASLALAASPIVNYSRLALDFHGDACVAAVVLAFYALWLTREPSPRRAVAGGVAVSVLAGATLASDALFAVVGLVPFALTGLVLLVVLRMRFQGLVVVACAAAAIPLSTAANSITARAGLDIVVSPRAPLRLAPLHDLWSNLGRLVGLVVQVADGNYTQSGWTHPALTAGYVLSVSSGVLILLGLALPFVLVGRELRSSPPSRPHTVWASFWALAVAGNCAGYALSVEGTQWGYYLIPVLYAVAATVPVGLSTTAARRRIGGVAIGVLAGTSLLSLAGRADMFGGLPPLASVADRVAAIAKAEHAPYGYTVDYWDAASLTWSTDLAVRVQPLWYCGAKGVLCPFLFNVVSTWYQPHPSRSFVVQPTVQRPGSAAYADLGMVDDSDAWVDTTSASILGRPSAVFRLNDQFSMYIYPYDVARRLDDHTDSVWGPSLTYGAGFNSSEQFDGSLSRWMIQGGQLEIRTGVSSRLTLSGEAFSNQRPRVVELVDRSGHVLGRDLVPTYAVPIRFGPFVVPAGVSTLRLVARPGPERLGALDPRQASVFLEPLVLSGTPAILGSSPVGESSARHLGPLRAGAGMAGTRR